MLTPEIFKVFSIILPQLWGVKFFLQLLIRCKLLCGYLKWSITSAIKHQSCDNFLMLRSVVSTVCVYIGFVNFYAVSVRIKASNAFTCSWLRTWLEVH
jgi:hypothetical protein